MVNVKVEWKGQGAVTKRRSTADYKCKTHCRDFTLKEQFNILKYMLIPLLLRGTEDNKIIVW